jgi:two-component system cell cycle sensor histidine kinase/response regulator CckA
MRASHGFWHSRRPSNSTLSDRSLVNGRKPAADTTRGAARRARQTGDCRGRAESGAGSRTCARCTHVLYAAVSRASTWVAAAVGFRLKFSDMTKSHQPNLTKSGLNTFMRGPLRVLIVEDSAPDAELLVRDLDRAGFSVIAERVQTADAMKAALERSPWDIVLSDYSMPGFSGTAALEILQATGHDLPFIIISGTIGEDAAVGALKAGAHDFLVKGRLARLIPTIDRELREVVHRRERRRAEDALRVSEARHRSLVEHAVFGIYQATLDGHFLTVNPALVTMLGYDSATDLLNVRVANLFADPEVRSDLLRSNRYEEQLTGKDAIWTRKTGEAIRVRLSGRLIDERVADRSVFEVIVEDVTERHRLQEQLQQALKMEAVGQLAGGVAHDFNNMLTAILGYTELLTDQIGPDRPVGADLRQIKAAAERAAALTRQLLAFSRKQVLTIEPVDLTQIVRGLDSMLRRVLGAPIRIETVLADDLHPVMADATQLEHLLINLSVNARDAMPQGGVLTMTTCNVELGATYVLEHPGARTGSYTALSVSDTGVGMSRDVQARIFEPFFTTKDRGHGTGLGLAAVYGTVKQLGGYIEVQSQPGRGSTFTIYLPETAVAPVARRARTVTAPPVGTETILLVEDEPGVRGFAKIALQRFGYRVLEAASAEAALALLENTTTPIHLLLSDLVLPGMDGRELAVHIKRDRPHVRILFMSGYDDRPVGLEGFREPGVQLLEKPFSAQTLLTKTKEVLEADAKPRHA